MVKVPAVNVDITDDGTAYTVTATPWPTLDGLVHPYTVRLVHTARYIGDKYDYPTKWTTEKLAAFVKKLMNTYPKAEV